MNVRRRDLMSGLAVSAFASSVAARPAPSRRTPDLSGIWTNATYTPLERSKAAPPHLVLTAGEAEAYEAPLQATHGVARRKTDVVGQAESEFAEMGAGLLRVRGEIRSSIITDPADGRIPYSAAGRAWIDRESFPITKADNPEELGAFSRCLATPGSGAPLIPSQDGNVVAIVQTADAVVFVCEKLHEARIVHLRPPAQAQPSSWSGTSVGRWEGGDLVVETTGLRPGLTDRFWFYLSDRSRVTERFRRTAPGEIAYSFTVEDPALLDRPWRGEMVFTPANAIYEYACHEGNYSMGNILSGARQQDGRPSS